jgi:hypothetical protein
MRIREGQLEGFKAQAAEILRLAREQDTQLLRYDWFINEAGMECEVHEAYVSEQGLIEHNQHVMGARDAFFKECAYDHQMSVYGEISEQLMSLFKKHAEGAHVFTFFQGLAASPAV